MRKKLLRYNRCEILLFAIGLLLLGCRKEDNATPPAHPADGACSLIPASLLNGQHTMIDDTLSVQYAVAHPDDPHTYIFFHKPPFVNGMFRAEMADFSLHQISEYSSFNYLRWVGGDTLLGIRNGVQARLFTSDGSFEQNLGPAVHANLGPLPGRFISLRKFNFGPPHILLGHFDGTPPDTLDQVLSGDLAWPSPDTVFAGGVVYAISSDEAHTVVETEGPTYLSVIDGSSYLLSDDLGLYLVDVASLSYTTLVEFRNCEVLSHPQYHHGTGRILASRTHRYTIPHSIVIINRAEIVWLNMQGEVEEVVDMLPLLFPG